MEHQFDDFDVDPETGEIIDGDTRRTEPVEGDLSRLMRRLIEMKETLADSQNEHNREINRLKARQKKRRERDLARKENILRYAQILLDRKQVKSSRIDGLGTFSPRKKNPRLNVTRFYDASQEVREQAATLVGDEFIRVKTEIHPNSDAVRMAMTSGHDKYDFGVETHLRDLFSVVEGEEKLVFKRED